jgi:DNA-binding XRE family transcriptional regulator
MKTLNAYIKKLPAAERAAIEDGARHKIATLRLLEAREASGLTQEEVAARMGVTQASLSRMEHRPDVKLSNIRKYVEALGGRLEVCVVLPQRAKRRTVATKRQTISRGRASPRRISLVSG